jgi:uncharacterized protein with HEPN domain
MSEYQDILDRLLRFIAECRQEQMNLDNQDESIAMMAYKSIALDLTQIGESVNSLRKKFPKKLATEPTVPWDDIVGLRNVLVHNYDGIIRDEIEESLNLNLLNLQSALERLKLI